MPRYFFDRRDGGFDPDDDGTELPDLDAARIEAVNFAAGTIRDRPDYVWDGKEFRVEVSNEEKTLLYTVIVLGIDAPAGKADRP